MTGAERRGGGERSWEGESEAAVGADGSHLEEVGR